MDDLYVYIHWGNGRYMRLDKRGGGEMEPFVECGCDSLDMVADGGYLYLLGANYLLRVHGQDQTQTRTDLLWDHAMRGGLMVDDTYAYMVMPGCAAITRVNKQTMTFDPDTDVMYIDGVEFPSTAGSTILERAGTRLVCGSPTELYLIEEWGAEAEVIHESYEGFWGLRPVGEDVFWIQGDAPDMLLGEAELLVGGTELFPLGAGASTHRLVYVPQIGRLLWGGARGNLSGLRTFDLATRTLEAELPVGSIADVAIDDEAVYATARTLAETLEYANWIARIAFTDLPGGR